MSSDLVITSMDPGKNMGGSKAKLDIINFLEEMGYTSYIVNPYVSKLKKLYLAEFAIPKDFKGKKYNNVIIQFPIPSEKLTKKLIKVIRENSPEAKIVFWIHDIQGLQSTDEEVTERELAIFELADELIVHNQAMMGWLKNRGYSKKMVNLEIFDYANPQPVNNNETYKQSLCFAGNLFKSEFLRKLQLEHTIDVFGPNMFTDAPNCINYRGQYSPEELPKYLIQNFGLIWDGPSVDTCTGTFGEYMRFNNPHKTSLYISSGLPIIIWKEAALAEFVQRNKIGIAIEKVSDIDKALASLSQTEYNEMKKNTLAIAQKLRTGHYTKAVVQKI